MKRSYIKSNLGWTQLEQHLDHNRSERANKNSNWAKIREQILPFRQLPDVSSITVRTSAIDPLFEKFGISKARDKAKLEIVPWNNKKYNRYLVFRLKYMKGLSDKAYWKQVNQLMLKSNVIWMTALRGIMPKWYKDSALWFVKRELKEAKKIVSESWKEYHSRRVYIPKPGGGSRPLGVPRLSWRLYLNLINNFMVYRLKEKISKSQHGFVPGRGTMTAWEQILKEVVDAKDIYEIDLKNAFNSISTRHVARTLDKHGLPKELVIKLLLCNISPQTFVEDTGEGKKPYWYKAVVSTEGDRINGQWYQYWETIVNLAIESGIAKHNVLRLLVKGASNFWKGKKKYFKDLEEKRLAKIPALYETNKRWSIDDLYEIHTSRSQEFIGEEDFGLGYMGSLWALGTSFKMSGISNSTKANCKATKDQLKKELLTGLETYGRTNAGVAQGSPVSPFIFALCVNDYFFKEISSKKIKCVAYADDAIFYGDIKNEKEILKPSRWTGLEINLEKSGWVKQNNTWKKELKFLGMVYIKEDKSIVWASSTRSGKSLIYDADLLVRMHLERSKGIPFANEAHEWTVRLEHLNEEIKDLISADGFQRDSFGNLDMAGKQVIKKLREERDYILKNQQSHGVELQDKLSKSGLFGFFQSRMYIGTWDYDINQEFRLECVKGSWVEEQRKNNVVMNIFNSSSYAYDDLLKFMRNPKTRVRERITRLPRRFEGHQYPTWWQRFKKYDSDPFFKLPPRISRVGAIRRRGA